MEWIESIHPPRPDAAATFMRIALCYDLKDDWLKLGYDEETVAEFDRVDTVDELEKACHALGHDVVRIGNLFALVRALAESNGEPPWDLVFSIAEGLHGFGREAAIPALLDAYQVPYVFSDPLVCAVTLHKATTKRVLRDQGVATPEFWVVSDAADVARIPRDGVLFAKPIAEGTSKGIGADARIASRGDLETVCARLLERFRQPVIVERFLPGREVTVGIVGSREKARSVGVMEVLLRPSADPEVYSYENKQQYDQRVDYRVIDDEFARRCAALALDAWRALDCRDAGRVDVRANAKGDPEVIEVNPLPGMHPVHSDLPLLASKNGIPFVKLMEWILESARERVGARPRR